ncbi:hypothetical protein KZ829_09205 [Actinoplanes hulinensis]|uniref:ANTAR domain-containing protein n=1 Tax=Actinoplanes hulinensis TaxID=1144547 RepID=A0ABS7AYZ7_9ACTN|nr:hypothetical protein [Actinoplanes hulinensis]MBW6433912.1 hypothetical protein [Actinoplanes hulinensis]
MNAVIDDVRSEALFASSVQRSQEPTPEVIRTAVFTMVDQLGESGCAEILAQEYGEDPDCAIGRMNWARDAVRLAFAG